MDTAKKEFLNNDFLILLFVASRSEFYKKIY